MRCTGLNRRGAVWRSTRLVRFLVIGLRLRPRSRQPANRAMRRARLLTGIILRRLSERGGSAARGLGCHGGEDGCGGVVLKENCRGCCKAGSDHGKRMRHPTAPGEMAEASVAGHGRPKLGDRFGFHDHTRYVALCHDASPRPTPGRPGRPNRKADTAADDVLADFEHHDLSRSCTLIRPIRRPLTPNATSNGHVWLEKCSSALLSRRDFGLCRMEEGLRGLVRRPVVSV